MNAYSILNLQAKLLVNQLISASLKFVLLILADQLNGGCLPRKEAKSSSIYKLVYDNDPLDITKPWLGNKKHRYNWLKIIKALIRNYPNVYADISYTLHDEKTYPILKNMLKDETLKYRILYGTDYYVVASEKDEPDIIKLVKSKLSKDEMNLIAHDNVIRFLSSSLNSVS